MWIIGCDFHVRYQQVAALDQETGESVERRLSHETKEAEAFYESLPCGARIGMEASCTAQWFERWLVELKPPQDSKDASLGRPAKDPVEAKDESKPRPITSVC